MRMQVRRSAALLLVLALVLSLSVCALAADASKLSLALGAPAVGQGEVKILVQADAAVGDGKVTVEYDPQCLSFANAEVGTAWPEGSDVSLRANATQEGKVIVAFAGVHEAQGDLVVLNFHSAAEGSTELALTDAYAEGTSELTVEMACASADYKDVKQSSWYHEGVDYAIANGYMGSTSTTELLFVPNGEMSRAQLATILYRLAGEPSVEGLENPFTDVKASKWYANAVVWAFNTGITTGTSATTFSPDTSLSREQMATFLFRYAENCGVNVESRADLSVFTDGSKVGKWSVDAMGWAVSVGLLGSTSTSEMVLSPKSVATRAQVAKILRTFDLEVMK